MIFARQHKTLGESDELIELRDTVNNCVSTLPNINFICRADVQRRLEDIQNLSFTDDPDRALLFQISDTLVRSWRNIDAGKPGPNEDTVRRLALAKLRETADVQGLFSMSRALASLSFAGRSDETSADNLLSIVAGMREILLGAGKDISPDLKTEAKNTLHLLSSVTQPNEAVQSAAQKLLDDLKASVNVEIGPVEVKTLTKRPSWVTPAIAMSITAIVSIGVVAYVLRFHGPKSLGFGMGRLRRRVERRRLKRN